MVRKTIPKYGEASQNLAGIVFIIINLPHPSLNLLIPIESILSTCFLLEVSSYFVPRHCLLLAW